MTSGARLALRGAALVLLVSVAPVPVLVAAPDTPGAPRVERVALPGIRFELTYRHSMFDIPVRERFVVDRRLRLVLEEIRSTRPDIIAYYDIAGAATRVAPGDVRIEGLHLAHDRLRIRSTGIGDRTLVVGDCAVPLRSLSGEGGAVTLEVRFRPAATAVPPWRERSCPSPA